MPDLTVWSVDPRTDTRRTRVGTEADAAQVDRVVRAAHATRDALADRDRRAWFLRAAADVLDADIDRLAAEGDAETALGLPRMRSEIGRTTGQLRAFADVVEAGGYLGIIIDHADGAKPDLRRYQVPLGVVAVYSASNFPFAFSVAGGDTASALAAGCPVVVKAHPDHPATSELTLSALRGAATEVGLPPEVVGLVHGFEAGVRLVQHPLVTAAGFTGSVRGGRALHDAAAARPTPIPFHGELGSLNPVVVTAAAAAERAEAIGAGLAGAMTLGVGQFCVKPGLVLAPSGPHGDRLVGALTGALDTVELGVLLDHRIRDNFLRGVTERAELKGVEAAPAPGAAGEHAVRGGAFTIAASELADGEHEPLFEECFGPVTVVVRYDTDEEILATLDRVPGSLTATVHIAENESTGTESTARLLARLPEIAGRIVIDDWPTGVAVTAAQHHGGPYPASTSTSTSVGATAIERWLRPVAYQNTPERLLPPELRDDNPLGLPRRVGGPKKMDG
ncbi:aldehyde dehydrogenase (NADP(+)) [Nocardia sp. NBC_01009]|uniref:aldehyde dehydrogenase (NADP(+)) n=1 Tax=Nocardia sp. NBC_01009 TaxID=2975996 RepID=UPI003863FC94|nr:aldehyde dehydrogenase (NADP(+)) [Nocardia sp. NBC_01009]